MFSFFAFTDADKGFWGNIIGALIGTIGAVVVAGIAVFIDRRQQKKLDEQKTLRDYNTNVIEAEISLNELATATLENSRLLENCATQQLGDFMMTLPRAANPRNVNTGLLRNPQLVNEWLTLTLRARVINRMLDDFLESYRRTRDSAFDAVMRGEQAKIDQQYFAAEHETLKAFAADTKRAMDGHFDSIIHLLAMVRAHGMIGKSPERKFKHPKDLDDFKLKKREITREEKKLRREFDPEKMFVSP
jgi:hypothetical protein